MHIRELGMRLLIIQYLKNKENGITLVETLISIVLLFLVLSIFLSVFSQSATVNKTSYEIIDATYLAQKEMERLYSISQDKLEKRSGIEGLGYNFTKEDENWLYFDNINVVEAVSSNSEYYTEIRLQNNSEGNLFHVVIEVYQRSDKSLQAKMQNVLLWGNDGQ